MPVSLVINLAGDGKLRDGSDCSQQFRDFLSSASSDMLARYVDECLNDSFEKSGLALQDIVNELGRRLDYQVENGFYQGTAARRAPDGIWTLAENASIVVEVKTSDAYRLNLNTIALYRDRLIDSSRITGESSILIVVGREDTGDLEAQVRGSRHAWTIRLISADALIRLVRLKERAEYSTIGKIHGILKPIEYTRVDAIIDVAFTALEEAEEEIAPSVQGSEGGSLLAANMSSDILGNPIDLKKAQILRKLESQGFPLVKKSRATYWSVNRETRAAVTVSKRYDAGNYWYAYHTKWDAFLKDAHRAFFVLGCSDRDVAYVIPASWIRDKLVDLNTSDTGTDDMFWHIHLNVMEHGSLGIRVRGSDIDLAEFAVALNV